MENQTKRVSQILARAGFDGALMDRIRVSSTIRDLRSLGEVWRGSSYCPVCLIRGLEGVCFETEDNAPVDEDRLEDDLIIAAISVY